MSSQRNLTSAFAGGIGIVVSILLAFAIEASWDARFERQAEEAMIDGIREEFAATLVQIVDLLAQHRRANTALVGFLDAPSPSSETDAEAAVNRLIGGLLVGDLLDPSTGTLEMLLASGRLASLSDPNLRALLWTGRPKSRTWKTRQQGCKVTSETTVDS